ncbi:hypothetical protein BsWGS_11272 [Bradybaena similaris]
MSRVSPATPPDDCARLQDNSKQVVYVCDSAPREINDIILNDITHLIHWAIVFIITPTISILGIIGNFLSLIVLAKHGFHKSSNVLLFSLAISDILFMIGINGPTKIMYEWDLGGFVYPRTTAHVLYVLYQLVDALNWTTGVTSLSIPVLVMVERLIAVFLPLRFASLVTVRRTVIAIVTPLIFAIILQTYIRTWFRFEYTFDRARNKSVGVAARTDIYLATRLVAQCLEIFFNSFFVFVIFVGCGCVAIGVKMRLVTKRRLTMTNRVCGQKTGKMDSDSTRTTKMLLCLCIFYTLASAPAILSSVLPKFMTFPVFTEQPNFRSAGIFIYHLYQLAFAINSSNNFLIYVATNKKFRDTFISIVFRPKTDDRKS